MNILDLLTKQEKNDLLIKPFTKGSTLFFEGDKCTSVCVVLEGLIKISTYSTDGKEIIFNIIHQDEMFGSNLIFSSSPIYKGYVTALENGELITIQKDKLIKLLKTNDKFLEKYLNIQSDFSKNEKLIIELLSIQSAKQRLLFFLKQNNNKYEYESITALSSELNLKRETLSRTISSLVKDRIIKKEGKSILLLSKYD